MVVQYRPQIWEIPIVPCGAEVLGHAPAALRIAGVTDLTPMGKHLAAGLLDCPLQIRSVFSENSAVTLAVVIGAHVKIRMGLSIGPPEDRLLIG